MKQSIGPDIIDLLIIRTKVVRSRPSGRRAGRRGALQGGAAIERRPHSTRRMQGANSSWHVLPRLVGLVLGPAIEDCSRWRGGALLWVYGIAFRVVFRMNAALFSPGHYLGTVLLDKVNDIER